LVGREVAHFFDPAAVVAGGPVNAGSAAVGIDPAGQVGADFLGDQGDLVLDFGRGEEGRDDAATVVDPVEFVHRTGAVEGDASLGAFLVRLHQDGGHDADLAV